MVAHAYRWARVALTGNFFPPRPGSELSLGDFVGELLFGQVLLAVKAFGLSLLQLFEGFHRPHRFDQFDPFGEDPLGEFFQRGLLLADARRDQLGVLAEKAEIDR